MHLLISPVAPLSDQPGDFRWTDPGELVIPSLIACDTPGCGCEVSFTGQRTGKATTLAVVADQPVSTQELRDRVIARARAAGWSESPDVIAEMLARLALSLTVAADLPVGTEVRVRHDHDTVVISAAVEDPRP